MPVEPYLDVLLLLMVVAAAVNDLSYRRIPNMLLLCAALGAIVLHLLSPTPLRSVVGAMCGVLTGLLVFLPFYLVRGMAAGDVKMMAAVGAFTGPFDALQVAILAWCAGGVMAIVIIICKGRLRHAMANLWAILRPMLLRLPPAPRTPEAEQGSVGSMPYGVAIAAGTIAVMVGHNG